MADEKIEPVADNEEPTVEEEVVVEEEEKEEEKKDEPPAIPAPEEYPVIPEAPAAIDPTAVETTESGQKYGWQQAPEMGAAFVPPCVHMGLVVARMQIRNHQIGNEWVCTCGQTFVVHVNKGGKKTLKPKDPVVE